MHNLRHSPRLWNLLELHTIPQSAERLDQIWKSQWSFDLVPLTLFCFCFVPAVKVSCWVLSWTCSPIFSMVLSLALAGYSGVNLTDKERLFLTTEHNNPWRLVTTNHIQQIVAEILKMAPANCAFQTDCCVNKVSFVNGQLLFSVSFWKDRFLT